MDDILTRYEKRREQSLKADRTFPLAGETLTHRASVLPEVGYRLARAQEKQATEMRAAAGEVKKLDDGESLENIDLDVIRSVTPDWELILVVDDTIRACLEPESHEAWDRLRSDANPAPMNFSEMFEFAGWLLGRVSGIPTVAPSDSSDGRTETATASKANSSSQAKTRTASLSVTSS